MPIVTCKLSPELNARLTATSRARRTTKSMVVREISEAQLSRRPARGQLRAYDLVKHLVGRLWAHVISRDIQAIWTDLGE